MDDFSTYMIQNMGATKKNVNKNMTKSLSAKRLENQSTAHVVIGPATRIVFMQQAQ